jgi:hypothetical protein
MEYYKPNLKLFDTESREWEGNHWAAKLKLIQDKASVVLLQDMHLAGNQHVNDEVNKIQVASQVEE